LERFEWLLDGLTDTASTCEQAQRALEHHDPHKADGLRRAKASSSQRRSALSSGTNGTPRSNVPVWNSDLGGCSISPQERFVDNSLKVNPARVSFARGADADPDRL
jgi:hypothetical protein